MTVYTPILVLGALAASWLGYGLLPAVVVGSIVLYTMESGIVRPAIVTAVEFETINVQVFVDGGNDGYSADQVAVWRQGVAYSAEKEPGTWHE